MYPSIVPIYGGFYRLIKVAEPPTINEFWGSHIFRRIMLIAEINTIDHLIPETILEPVMNYTVIPISSEGESVFMTGSWKTPVVWINSDGTV